MEIPDDHNSLSLFNTMIRYSLGVLALISLLAHASFAASPDSKRLICCGAEEVDVVDVANPLKQLWSWRASDSDSIPESFGSKFRSTDDCNPTRVI